jgi:hypothetical protein
MKNLITAAALLLSLISFSCEEDFNPKADFKQKYVLWSVINADYRYLDTRHSVILSRLYNVDGYDPSVNTIDPVITGADVRLYADDVEYLLEQDTTIRRDTSRYTTPIIYYRTINPVKLRFASKLRVSAKLPTGEILRSETRLPVNQGLEFSDEFPGGVTTLFREMANSWTVWWSSEPNHLFFPRLTIRYTKKENDTTTVLKTLQVPLRYNGSTPHYPDYTLEQSVNFSFDAIDSAMAKISEGDSDKSKYFVQSFVFDLLEMDSPFSNYYSSINGYLDNYSVRLDEMIYSNISGGIGIFGSTFLISRVIPVSDAYAKKFGYN